MPLFPGSPSALAPSPGCARPAAARRLLARALLAGAAGFGCAAQAAEAGRVVFVAGSASVGVRALVNGDAIQEGDELRTGADGFIYMRTVDKGLLILRPASRARIVAYHVDEQTPGNTRVKLELLNGVARSISGQAVKEARQNFRFNTPVAAIGVRGTDFTVFTDQETSRVTVLSGAVVVSGFEGSCGPAGGGPCEHKASRELSAAQPGQMLQVRRGQATPQMVASGALAPDAVAPPRADEPLARKGGAAPARQDDSSSAGDSARNGGASAQAGDAVKGGAASTHAGGTSTQAGGTSTQAGGTSTQAGGTSTQAGDAIKSGATSAQAGDAVKGGAATPAGDAVKGGATSVPMGESIKSGAGAAAHTAEAAKGAAADPLAPSVASLDPKKTDEILYQKVSNDPPPPPPPPPPPVVYATDVWGRWASVLNNAPTIDPAGLSGGGAEVVARNSYYAIYRTRGVVQALPELGSVGFALRQSEAMLHNEKTGVIMPAQLENGQLQVDFGKGSFATSFDLTSYGESFKMQAQGQLGADGRMTGDVQFVAPTNMNVNGIVGGGGASAAYVFSGRIDATRIANGVTSWGR